MDIFAREPVLGRLAAVLMQDGLAPTLILFIISVDQPAMLILGPIGKTGKRQESTTTLIAQSEVDKAKNC